MYISAVLKGAAFCLPSKAGKPDLLKEEENTPIRVKLIRIAGAFLVTEGSEGEKRNLQLF